MSLFRITLFVSLALNLFAAGWWVGGIWRRPPPMQPQALSMSKLVEGSVSPQTMRAIGPSLMALDSIIKSGFEQRATVFGQLRAAVAADPYDANRVSELLAQLVSQRTDTESQQWQLISDTLSHLSADQREALAAIVFLPPGPLPEPPRGPDTSNGPTMQPPPPPPAPPDGVPPPPAQNIDI